VIYLKSLAVTDQAEQRHTGLAFAGNVSLAPIALMRAQAFRGTIDANAEFLTADQVIEHLKGVIALAVSGRSQVLTDLNGAMTTGKRFLADLRKLIKDGASHSSVAAQAAIYHADLSAAVEYDQSSKETRTAEFLPTVFDRMAFDPAAVKAGLLEFADIESAISAAREALRELADKVKAIEVDSTANIDEAESAATIPPSILDDLAAIRSTTAALVDQISAVADQLRIATR